MNTLARISELKKSIIEFRDNIDAYNAFDGSLDDDGPIQICGLWFNRSDILKELDPVAYRCGCIEYIDSIDLEDFQEYCDLLDELEELEGTETNKGGLL